MSTFLGNNVTRTFVLISKFCRANYNMAGQLPGISTVSDLSQTPTPNFQQSKHASPVACRTLYINYIHINLSE